MLTYVLTLGATLCKAERVRTLGPVFSNAGCKGKAIVTYRIANLIGGLEHQFYFPINVSPRNHAISVTMAVSPRFGSQFGAIPKDASSSKKKKKGKKKGKFLASAALSVGTFCWPFWGVRFIGSH